MSWRGRDRGSGEEVVEKTETEKVLGRKEARESEVGDKEAKPPVGSLCG